MVKLCVELTKPEMSDHDTRRTVYVYLASLAALAHKGAASSILLSFPGFAGPAMLDNASGRNEPWQQPRTPDKEVPHGRALPSTDIFGVQ